MAARKSSRRKQKRAARPSGRGDGSSRLWPAKLGISALRVFTGAIFLAVTHWKLIRPDLPLGEVLTRFTEHDYLPLVHHAVANPPRVFGWEMTWFADLLEAVALPGKAPYVIATAVLFFEGLLGVALVLGACTRLLAFLGALLITTMGLAKGLPFLTVTQGTNWFLAMALLTLSLTAAGRIWGLDGLLRRRLPGWIA